MNNSHQAGENFGPDVGDTADKIQYKRNPRLCYSKEYLIVSNPPITLIESQREERNKLHTDNAFIAIR